MNWKGPVTAFIVLLVILIVYSILSMGNDPVTAPTPENFSFDFSTTEHGVLDVNGKAENAYLTADFSSSGSYRENFLMLLLKDRPKTEVYEITDYKYSDDKQKILENIKKELRRYGLTVSKKTLAEVMNSKDSIIIIPSDAMPAPLCSGDMEKLIGRNVILFYGKELDICLDTSGSQEVVDNALYAQLQISHDAKNQVIEKTGGSEVYSSGTGTIVWGKNGWFVYYGDLKEEDNGKQIADMILRQKWQKDYAEKEFSGFLKGGNETFTFYSNPTKYGDYYIRLIYSVSSEERNISGIYDAGLAVKRQNILSVNEKSGSSKPFYYSFELHDNFTYPQEYDLSLEFIHNGNTTKRIPIQSITMKTVSIETGTVNPTLTSGDYVVKLKDQNSNEHAAAFTHVPQVKLDLIMIDGTEHVFLATVDGQPARSVPVRLIANNKDVFDLRTDSEGKFRVFFVLAPQVHSFTAEINGEKGTVYYKKEGESIADLMPYIALLGGSLFLVMAFILRSKKERKWAIKTHNRPPVPSKTISVPYDNFVEIFRRTQNDRACGLPISISDLRTGINKYAVYKGRPIFLTDSNIYYTLDSLVKRGKFLSFSGYFLPKENAGDKPIEYWVLKRKLMDYFLERGDEIHETKDADFLIRGKMIHVWQDFNPKKLLALCKKTVNIIIFPDDGRKNEFIRMASSFDRAWMKTLLEIQYGNIYCYTLEEFFKRGAHV